VASMVAALLPVNARSRGISPTGTGVAVGTGVKVGPGVDVAVGACTAVDAGMDVGGGVEAGTVVGVDCAEFLQREPAWPSGLA